MAPSPTPEATGPDVVAAGAVVLRRDRRGGRGADGGRGREVLLVHRPKYDDWSFPKGKQDPDEHVTATAVREVLEETGVEIRLGRPLLPQLYAVSGGRAKTVHYWVGQVVGDDDVSAYEPNDEVDQVGWFTPEEARTMLTYLDDLSLLDQLHEARRSTTALLVVRHAKALKRAAWDGPDPLRPLNPAGEKQAEALAPILHAYGVVRVVSSSSTRCVQTVAPYAEEQVLAMDRLEELSEEGYDEAQAAALLTDALATREPTVVCSHRPVLPSLFTLLDLDEEPLSPAELVVVHHRKGEIMATERHLARPARP